MIPFELTPSAAPAPQPALRGDAAGGGAADAGAFDAELAGTLEAFDARDDVPPAAAPGTARQAEAFSRFAQAWLAASFGVTVPVPGDGSVAEDEPVAAGGSETDGEIDVARPDDGGEALDEVPLDIVITAVPPVTPQAAQPSAPMTGPMTGDGASTTGETPELAVTEAVGRPQPRQTGVEPQTIEARTDAAAADSKMAALVSPPLAETGAPVDGAVDLSGRAGTEQADTPQMRASEPAPRDGKTRIAGGSQAPAKMAGRTDLIEDDPVPPPVAEASDAASSAVQAVPQALTAAPAAQAAAPAPRPSAADVQSKTADAAAAGVVQEMPAFQQDSAMTGGEGQSGGRENRPSAEFTRFAAALAQVARTGSDEGSAGTVTTATAAVQGGSSTSATTPATATAATVATPTDVPGDENVARLVQAMRVIARPGAWEATVRLKPEHLGNVTIAIRVERNTVSAVVQAEAAGVRQWLENQEQAVRAGMAEHGLHLDRFVVDREGQRREAPSQHDEQRPRRQRAANREDARFEIVV